MAPHLAHTDARHVLEDLPERRCVSMDVATMAELSCRVVRLHCRALRPAADEEGHQHSLSIPLSTPCSLHLALSSLPCSVRHCRSAELGLVASPLLRPSSVHDRLHHHLPLTTPPLPHSPVGHATPCGAGAACHRRPGRRRSWPGRVGPPLSKMRPPSSAHQPPGAPPPPHRRRRASSGRNRKLSDDLPAVIRVRDFVLKFD